MKEMENNDFIHTLDAVYNLCSEIKEWIASVETTDEEESNEGIIRQSATASIRNGGNESRAIFRQGRTG